MGSASTSTQAPDVIGRDTSYVPLLGESTRGRLTGWLVDLLVRRALLWRVNLTLKGRLSGRSVAVPLLFGHGTTNLRLGEPWLLDVLAPLLAAKRGAFLDVGVNFGQTLLKVKTVDPARAYIGIEPNPLCVTYVQQLVERNAFRDCSLLPCAAGSAPALARLFTKRAGDPSASLVDGFRDASRYSSWQYVPVLEGDAVLQTLGNPAVGVIKIDVEGAELDALRGLQQTLRRWSPYVLCEILPVFDQNTPVGEFRQRRQTELETLMASAGYVLFRLFPGNRLERLSSIETHADLSRCNYLFAPSAEIPTLTSGFHPV